VKLGYNELDEHSVIMNRFLGRIGYFSTKINPVMKNPGYNRTFISTIFLHKMDIFSFVYMKLGRFMVHALFYYVTNTQT
jgi:hypothetical protein